MSETVKTEQGEESKVARQVWECKIGGPSTPLPNGADLPMRLAIAAAYAQITGSDPEFIFSGWGRSLTELELAVVEHRLPRYVMDDPGGDTDR